MHILILGMTESGKTTIAKLLIKEFKAKGLKTLVLDPLKDPAFNADYQTADQKEFLNVFFASRTCLAVMDEGGESVGRYNEAMQTTATRGRHWGHTCVYLAQKAVQVAPIIRDQCGAVFMFTSGLQSAKAIAEEFNCPEFLNATQLKRGDYIYKSRFGDVVTGSAFD